MMNDDEIKIRNKNRRSLILLAVLFILPLLAAWFILKNINTFAPSGTRNYGELVRPARPLSDFTLQQSNGEKFGLKEMRGKWNVIYFGGNDCNKLCQEAISKVHQARLGQGADMHRVRDLYINIESGPMSAKSIDFLKKAPDFSVLRGSAAEINNLLAQFQATGVSPKEEGTIFIVDPHANIMMTYKKTSYVRDLLKDLERLLKYSQIG